MSTSTISTTPPHYQKPRTSFGESIANCFKSMFLCCATLDSDDEYDDGPGKPIQIGVPTDFRRHELNLPGLSPELQDRYRRKQQEDAIAMYNDLRPLQSSPSSQFAERPATATRVTYEQFTQPRNAPSPLSPSSRRTSTGQRVVNHARRLSETLTGGMKFSGGGNLLAAREGDVEIRGLMDNSRTELNVPPPSDVVSMKRAGENTMGYKMSEESLDSRDDSAKGGIGKI
ncbi:hypothetical protein DOTSEDRAFT_27179 [Dothistroma septosporum NZE10]|uniref:Uncharacterized protein n=1 Tax=Dothistroma septosporum (strain NZE10 / CBS 128990) TaxID=675120 RepID=N1PDU4_DOTSN|nr:hypothetical protein DOTSEDRAFT_27179 [Dothistroma septosporum NZE10]